MTALSWLLPVALLLGLLGLIAFLWALRSGQFDDLDGAAWRILQDDEPTATEPKPAAPARPSIRTAKHAGPPEA